MPFGALFFIVYGFLRELRIFGRTPIANVWIALTATTMVLFPVPRTLLGIYGKFWGFSAYAVLLFYFKMIGWIAMTAFFALFTVGVYYYYLKKKRMWSTTAGVYNAFRSETKNIRSELAEISAAIGDAASRLGKETNPEKRVALELSLRELQDRRRDIQERLTELREASRNM